MSLDIIEVGLSYLHDVIVQPYVDEQHIVAVGHLL